MIRTLLVHLLASILILAFPMAGFAQSNEGLIRAVKTQPLTGVLQTTPQTVQKHDSDRDSLMNGAAIGAGIDSMHARRPGVMFRLRL